MSAMHCIKITAQCGYYRAAYWLPLRVPSSSVLCLRRVRLCLRLLWPSLPLPLFQLCGSHSSQRMSLFSPSTTERKLEKSIYTGSMLPVLNCAIKGIFVNIHNILSPLCYFPQPLKNKPRTNTSSFSYNDSVEILITCVVKSYVFQLPECRCSDKISWNVWTCFEVLHISLKREKPHKTCVYSISTADVESSKANNPHRTRMWTLRWTRSSYCAFPLWHQCQTKKREAFQLTSFWAELTSSRDWGQGSFDNLVANALKLSCITGKNSLTFSCTDQTTLVKTGKPTYTTRHKEKLKWKHIWLQFNKHTSNS